VAAPIGDDPDWQFFGRLVRSYASRSSTPIALPFRSNFDPEAVLVGAGFAHTRAFDQEISFVFADETAWWDWVWSHGMRALLEALPPPALEALRREAFAELGGRIDADGLHLRHTARFVLAAKAVDGGRRPRHVDRPGSPA